MSRHQAVKNMDVDDYLDDFDGGDYEEEGYGEPEITEEDREQLRLGTIEVRKVLGNDAPVSDRDIQDSLWHTYYDIEKTVAYLLTAITAREGKAKNNNKALFHQVPLPPSISPPLRIPKDFWDEMRWLDTPRERHTTFIPPCYPQGGLLGGSSAAPPKMSKLQALAAARRKKAQDQKSSGLEEVEKPMAGLAIALNDGTTDDRPEIRHDSTNADTANSRSYADRKRKNLEPHPKITQPADPVEMELVPQPEPIQASPYAIAPPDIEQAAPSAFANTMFSEKTSKPSSTLFTLPYLKRQIDNSADAFAGPSPDDVVLAAQSKAANAKSKPVSKPTTKTNGKEKAPSKTRNEDKEDQISGSVEALKIDDTPRASSKNLDVLAEFEKQKSKNAANFVVIGHVDAGKSTLMGRLLMDLDVVDQRTIERYRKEAEKMGKSSFALAWVLDQGSEERARGVTIDVATNKFETAKTAFTILDAPGHKDFIPNMIAGAAQADFAVLVIDASRGSFESGLKGQTKEHALLVRSMGVQRIIIAVNKLDTVSWSQDRFEEISQQVSAFLLAAGFQQRNISFIPLSGLHGDNILRRTESPEASWYTGLTLVEELDRSEPISRALNKPLRFTIGDVFRGGVQNPLSISGRIEAGSLQGGDPVLVQPANQKAFIKSLEVDNEPVDWAVAGQNVTLNLSEIDPNHLKIGDVLCSQKESIVPTKTLTAKVLAFEYLVPGGVDVHRGRLHAAGRLSEFVAVLDKVSGAVTKKKPRVVKPGSVARVVVELDHLVPLEKGNRIVLRSGGETIAAGLLE